jgi:Cu/Zn superoxide dismutase
MECCTCRFGKNIARKIAKQFSLVRMVKASKWIEVSHNHSSVQMTKIALWLAVATVGGVSTVFGTITFEQFDESSPTNISWNIRGNHTNSLTAFHIHEFGDKTNGCTSAGPHCTLASIPSTTLY